MRAAGGSSAQTRAVPAPARKRPNASSRASRPPQWSRWSGATLVTTATSTGRSRNVPSLSSASTTNHSPMSHRAPTRLARRAQLRSPPAARPVTAPAASASAGMLGDEGGDGLGGIATGDGDGGGGHGLEGGPVVDQGVHLGDQSGTVELGVDHH